MIKLAQIKKRGFTLLELMLVLALVAVLTVAGLAAYQIQFRNFRVDKTALQMQQWLQAGMAFYVDCNQWPADSKLDPNILNAMMGLSPLTPTECKPYQNQIRAYMPQGSDGNGPWQNSYQIGPDTPNSTMFYVNTDIGPDSPLMENVGKMIAGRLPNATSDVEEVNEGKHVFVEAKVGVPGQALADKKHALILNMQVVPTGQLSNIKQPTPEDCPPGMQPVVDYAIAGLASGQASWTHLPSSLTYGVREADVGISANAQNFLVPQLQPYGNCPESDPRECQYYPDNTLGNNKVLIITACIPNATSSSANSQSSVYSASSNGTRF